MPYVDPKVTVVIPAYNRPTFTTRAIRSVAQQTYDHVELICVDDGSNPPLKDNISLPLDAFEEARVIRHDHNRGASAARNTALNHASGTYIAFLDSDDQYQSDYLTRAVNTIKNEREMGHKECIGSYTGIRRIMNSELFSRSFPAHEKITFDMLAQGNPAGGLGSCTIVHRSIIDAGTRFDENLCSSEDYDFFLRVLRYSKYLVRVPGYLVDVYLDSPGRYSDNIDQLKKGFSQLVKKHQDVFKPTRIAHQYKILGKMYAYSEKNWNKSRAYFIESFIKNPCDVVSYYYTLITIGRKNTFEFGIRLKEQLKKLLFSFMSLLERRILKYF